MSNEITIQQGMSLAEAMGFSSSSNVSSLYQMNVVNTAITVEEEDGERIAVPVGSFKLTKGDEVVYSKGVSVRLFTERHQWQQWDNDAGVMHKTLMSNNLQKDLKDTKGGFNIGRPTGYIKDFKALPEATQKLVRSVKRTKIFMGMVTLTKPIDALGKEVTGYDEELPFSMSLRNTDSIKSVDAIISAITSKKFLPIEHTIELKGKKELLPTGGTYAVVLASLGSKVDMKAEDSDTLNSFLDYISRGNEYVLKVWDEKQEDVISAADAELVGEFIDVEVFE